MYTFTNIKEKSKVKYLGKNDSGQILELTMDEWYYLNSSHWYVCFEIKNKRKHEFKYRQQVGKDGLKSLLWAKYCLVDFINNHLDNNKDNVIIVQWDDSKRKRAYVRFLSEVGFKLTVIDRRPSLILKIK